MYQYLAQKTLLPSPNANWQLTRQSGAQGSASQSSIWETGASTGNAVHFDFVSLVQCCTLVVLGVYQLLKADGNITKTKTQAVFFFFYHSFLLAADQFGHSASQ